MLWVVQKMVTSVILQVLPNVINFLKYVSFGLKKYYTGQMSVNQIHRKLLNTEQDIKGRKGKHTTTYLSITAHPRVNEVWCNQFATKRLIGLEG